MIQTPRLDLLPLSSADLDCGLQSIECLSRRLSRPLVADLYAGRARHAVEMKISRMANLPEELIPWYTYWLIILRDENLGVGMLGYKGEPGEKGDVEIGYGISPLYQGRGIMTEAVKALTAWAFDHPECKLVTATRVKLENTGSQRVLEKSGFKKIFTGPDGISYILERD